MACRQSAGRLHGSPRTLARTPRFANHILHPGAGLLHSFGSARQPLRDHLAAAPSLSKWPPSSRARRYPGCVHPFLSCGGLRTQGVTTRSDGLLAKSASATGFLPFSARGRSGESVLLGGAGCRNSALSHRLDVAYRRLAEKTAVLTAERAYAFISDFVCGVGGVNAIR
jgi:hypothetical protein